MSGAVGYEKRQGKPDWWDYEIEEQIKKKKQLHLKILQANDESIKQEYRDNVVKREVINKKNTAWMKKWEYIEQHIGGTQNSEAWKTLKNLKNSQKPNKTNNIPKQQWTQYLKKLLQEERKKIIKTVEIPGNDTPELYPITRNWGGKRHKTQESIRTRGGTSRIHKW